MNTVACPVADTLAKLKNAHGTIAATEAVLASIGNPAAWPVKVKSAWVTTHYVELLGLLERALQERTSSRKTYRDTAANKLGALTTALVKADGNNAADSELERLHGQLAEIEDDLADREHRLNSAASQVKVFKLSNGIDAGRDSYHGELFKVWTYAKEAVLAVDFEPHIPNWKRLSLRTRFKRPLSRQAAARWQSLRVTP